MGEHGNTTRLDVFDPGEVGTAEATQIKIWV